MAQTNFTPISLYYSATAAAVPTAGNLVAGELAINTADGKLFYKDSAGVVQVIGTKGGVGSSTNTQVLYNSSGLVVGDADFTFNGTTVTIANDASISGLTVGKGGGAVATNTALGNLALSSTNTGVANTGVGYAALLANTSGQFNTAIGASDGVGVYGPLRFNTTGGFNIAVGSGALGSNTTASNNTAVGYQALYSGVTAERNTAVGRGALYASTGSYNTAVGDLALNGNTTGTKNASFSIGSLQNNTTGSNNVALGTDALKSNTTASNNTAVGQEAGFSNTTGTGITILGYQAGYSQTTGNRNTLVGIISGYSLTTGSGNTFVGTPGSSNNAAAGYFVTTGNNNTIIGGYTGNQGGLDIRTASNYIVLSDGDGNPRVWSDTDSFVYGASSASDTSGVGFKLRLNGGAATTVTATHNTATSYSTYHVYNINATNNGYRFYVNINGGIANFSGNNTNLSDERTKTNVELAGNYLEKICSIPVKLFNYKDEAVGEQRTLGVIAQDVELFAPELVCNDGFGETPQGEEKLKSVYTTDMMFAMMKAIQELKAEFDAYKATHP